MHFCTFASDKFSSILQIRKWLSPWSSLRAHDVDLRKQNMPTDFSLTITLIPVCNLETGWQTIKFPVHCVGFAIDNRKLWSNLRLDTACRSFSSIDSGLSSDIQPDDHRFILQATRFTTRETQFQAYILRHWSRKLPIAGCKFTSHITVETRRCGCPSARVRLQYHVTWLLYWLEVNEFSAP